MQQFRQNIPNSSILPDSVNPVTRVTSFSHAISKYSLDALQWLYPHTQHTPESLRTPDTLQYSKELSAYIKMLLCVDVIKRAPQWEQRDLMRDQSNALTAYLLDSIDTTYAQLNSGASVTRSLQKFNAALSRAQNNDSLNASAGGLEPEIRNRVFAEYAEAEKGRFGRNILMRILALLTFVGRWPISREHASANEEVRIASKIIMDGYIQMINALHLRISQAPNNLQKESHEFNLAVLRAGQDKMAKTLLDLIAPKEAISIYRAIGCHINKNTPGWNSHRYYTRNATLTDIEWILSHSEGRGASTMRWRGHAAKQFTYISHDGLGTLEVCDDAGVGSHITGAILVMPEYTFSGQSKWYGSLPHQQPLAQATLLNCSAPRWGILGGLQGARIISSFNRGNVHFALPHTAFNTNRPEFEMSLFAGVYSGSFGRVKFSDETGKSSIFILSGLNTIEAAGDRTLKGAVIFVENPAQFNLALKDGAGNGLLIASEQPFINEIQCGEQLSSNPRTISPETPITAEDITQLSQEMYNRLPYIRATYRPLFEEMTERRKSLETLKASGFRSFAKRWEFPAVTIDRLDTTLFFGGLETQDQTIICTLFGQIEREERAIFTERSSNTDWETTTTKQAIALERATERRIEKARLAGLERAILEPIKISQDTLNEALYNFFNPYTISAITHHPEQKLLYESLSTKAKNILAEYLKQMSIEYPHVTDTPDWVVFIRTFNFLRALESKLLRSHRPSELLFAEPIKQSAPIKSSP